MRVVSISLDKKILEEGSENQNRQKEYGALCDELHVIVLSTKKIAPQKIGDNTWVYSTSSKSKLLYYIDVFLVAKKLQNIDLVTSQDPSFSGLIAYFIAKRFKAKLHIQIHIDFFSLYFKNESLMNRIQILFASFVIKRANGIRAVSGNIKNYLVSRMSINSAKVLVLPVYVDVAKIMAAEPAIDLHAKYPQFDKIILMASRLVKQKNIGYAIDAMEEVVKRHPKVGLIIVGSGPEERGLKLKTVNRKLETSVVFESWSSQIFSYYKTADLYLLSSYYEGFVRTALEAMAAGCPVAMTDTLLAGDIFAPDASCLTFPLNNVSKLSQQIMRALENPEILNSLRTNAFEKLKSLPTKEEYLGQYKKSWQNCFS